MGKRKPVRNLEEHPKTSSPSSSLVKNIKNIREENTEDDTPETLELAIKTYLSSITELRNKVSLLQEKRKKLEDNVLGTLDCTLSIKKQWKLIKKLKNEGNRTIYSFIQNLREENKKIQKSLESAESRKLALEKVLEDRQAQDEKLSTCSICMNFYCKPFIVECGHSFCYFCLIKWVKRQEWNGRCPSCRTRLVKVPFPALFIEQQLDSIVGTMAEKSRTEYLEKLEINKNAFSNLSNPWGDWFQSTNNIIEDQGDNVNRCGQCGWEILSEFCDRCDSYFPDYRVREGENLMDSSEDDGIDIQFSENDANGGEADESEADSEAHGFIVNDDFIEYESGHDDNLSDRSSPLSLERSHQQRRPRGNVIEVTDEESS